MAKNEPFDDTVASWLQETAPARIPERVLSATFERTGQTKQQVGWRVFLGRPEMRRFASALSGAVVLVLVAAVGVSIYVNQQGIGRPRPTATPVEFPALTTTFVSPINGYSFRYLDRGGLMPATEPWDPITQRIPRSSGANNAPFDTVETGLAAFFIGASTTIPTGVSIDTWVDTYITPGLCRVPRSQQAEISIDGQSGRIAECPNEIDATVVAGGRLYLFTLLNDRPDARTLFDAWAATIHLVPQDASAPTATPAS